MTRYTSVTSVTGGHGDLDAKSDPIRMGARPRRNTPTRKAMLARRERSLKDGRWAAFEDGDGQLGRWIGIDLGSRTGMAVLDMRVPMAVCVRVLALDMRLKRGEGGGLRPLALRRYLEEELFAPGAGPVLGVGYEIVHAHAGTYAAQVFGQLQGILISECELRGIAYQTIPVSHAKFAATGNGSAKKGVVARYMVELVKPYCRRVRTGARLSEDETDALSVLLALRMGLT